MSERALDRLPAGTEALMSLWRRLTHAHFTGVDNLPSSGPVMLVGNHTLLGLYDTPVLLSEVYRQRGYVLRAMGDHAHFRVPGWSWLLRRHGAVPGTPVSCRALLERGEAVLVFPGGGREVSKRRGERYRLIWGDRCGFARIAVHTATPIVPFCAVGAEEAWDLVLDADELMRTPVGPLVRHLGIRQSVLLPVVRGMGPTPIPRLVELRFAFLPPVDPRAFAIDPENEAGVFALREAVRQRIEAAIAGLRP